MPQPTSNAKAYDLQTYPFVMIPKRFFVQFKPSIAELGAYIAIKYFAINRTGKSEWTSIPKMARLVDLSTRTFQRAVASLAKKGAVRIKHRTRKTSGGKRFSMPNIYEVLDLQPVADDDPPI